MPRTPIACGRYAQAITLTAPAASGRCHNESMQQRFLSLADVAEILSISMSQVRALVRSGELKGIQIGGKGTWRVEDTQLQDYIDRMYARTQERLRAGDGPD